MTITFIETLNISGTNTSSHFKKRWEAFCAPRSVSGMISCKVLSNFRNNLTISHLIHRFYTNDASTKFVSLKTFLQVTLGLTRTKYQNSFCITNTRYDCIIIYVEMSRKLFLAAVICGNLQCFIWTLKRWITGTAALFFNLRYDQLGFFPLVRNHHNHSLPMVHPQTHFYFHRFLLCLSVPLGVPDHRRLCGAMAQTHLNLLSFKCESRYSCIINDNICIPSIMYDG